MLTFEKIRELERNEREGKKLQRLPDDLMDNLRDYIQRKERIQEKTSADIMEQENVKNTIKRFFEMREQKLISSALDTVRTGMPPENMTKEEEKVFYGLVDMVKRFRESFFEELGRSRKEAAAVYRVKKSLPDFVGPDMKVYKLSENELVSLPPEVETLLLKEGVIEKVEG